MTTFSLKINTEDSDGKGRVVLTAQILESGLHHLEVTSAEIETDEHGTPTANAITALRCLAHLETIASHATSIDVPSPDAEIADLKAEVEILKYKLAHLDNTSAL
jgi:hypothetical protein